MPTKQRDIVRPNSGTVIQTDASKKGQATLDNQEIGGRWTDAETTYYDKERLHNVVAIKNFGLFIYTNLPPPPPEKNIYSGRMT